MLELRRLAVLAELHRRGTIAAVAEALSFTPSAISQQLATLEREAGAVLVERIGRGVRLTDAGLLLVEHARVLLDGVAQAETDLAASSGAPVGRIRIATLPSVARRLVVPALATLSVQAPRVRCELVEIPPESALDLVQHGDLDVALVDDWPHLRRHLSSSLRREELVRDDLQIVLPDAHPAAQEAEVDLAALSDAAWVAGHPALSWHELTVRTCRERGGFDPDIRHRVHEPHLGLALVAAGLAVALVPGLVAVAAGAGVVVRTPAGEPVHRAVSTVTRTSDDGRPALGVTLGALRAAARGIVQADLARAGRQPCTDR